MAEKNNLVEQMLEHLVNGDQQKAEDLFHEYVVGKSREIYEGLIDSELAEETKDEDEDEDEDKKKDSEIEEDFEEIALEADPTDDLASELDSEDEMDMGDDELGDDDSEDKDPEELFQDLDAIVDELQAKFDELKGGDEGDMDMGGDDEMKDDFDLETVREYVEKVPAGHGAEKKGAAEKADNKKSLIDNMKNDMGGTTANILSSKEDGGDKGTAGGLAKNKAQEMQTGNINVPGGKAGGAFSTKESGHGAEKKGQAEQADNKQSLFRGRR